MKFELHPPLKFLEELEKLASEHPEVHLATVELKERAEGIPT